MRKETFYFIFGMFACRAYQDGELNDVAKFIANGDGMLSNLMPGDHPGELLREFQGWDDWVSVEEEEYMEINNHISRYNTIKEKGLKPILIANSGNGVFIPKIFMGLYPELLSEDQIRVLSGDPNATDEYWDVWDEVLNFATITDGDGVKYYLHHEEDLWAVPVDYDFNDFIE